MLLFNATTACSCVHHFYYVLVPLLLGNTPWCFPLPPPFSDTRYYNYVQLALGLLLIGTIYCHNSLLLLNSTTCCHSVLLLTLDLYCYSLVCFWVYCCYLLVVFITTTFCYFVALLFGANICCHHSLQLLTATVGWYVLLLCICFLQLSTTTL